MDVATYTRVARLENGNLDAQTQAVVDYCQQHGLNIVAAFSDVGSGLDEERPGLKSLLASGLKKVVVLDRSRLSRSMEQLFDLESEIEVMSIQQSPENDLPITPIVDMLRVIGDQRTE